MNPDQSLIFKVATRSSFETERSAEGYLGMPIDRADGYMHFSTARQLRETLSRHFAGGADLVLLGVEAAALGAAVRWEPSRGGDLFPHLYGPLPLTAIVEQAEIAVAADGSVSLPAWAEA